ncbi:hypothetical protein VIGAN_UM069100, partial [Vigna angularis var. angularis]
LSFHFLNTAFYSTKRPCLKSLLIVKTYTRLCQHVLYFSSAIPQPCSSPYDYIESKYYCSNSTSIFLLHYTT